MSDDNDHTTTNFTLYPALLQAAGYKTAALGKWDVGFLNRDSSPTRRGFDTFFGYYQACTADYWYHASVTIGSKKGPCGAYNVSLTDWSDSVGEAIGPPPNFAAINGTYNAELLSRRAVDIVAAHDAAAAPLFMYLAFHNVHDGCNLTDVPVLAAQAPRAYVDRYATTVLDTYKVTAAMITSMDDGVAAVVAAIKAKKMWEETFVIFVSDNGGPLEHSTNYPLRGGKHTFFEGGIRVEGVVAGGALPAVRRGSTWDGMAASADWYRTLVEGAAGVAVDPATTGGPRPLDSLNLWPAILGGGPSPRTEVVTQVNNSYFDEGVSVIRVGDMKLIRGPPGDNRTLAWPAPGADAVPLGLSGAVIEPGTDHVRAPDLKSGPPGMCKPWCLFNLSDDLGEAHDLSRHPAYAGVAERLAARLDAAASTGPLPAFLHNSTYWNQHVFPALCNASRQRGSVQPLDLSE